MRNFIRWVIGRPYQLSAETVQGREDLEQTHQRLDAIDRAIHRLETASDEERRLHIYGNLIDRRKGTRIHEPSS